MGSAFMKNSFSLRQSIGQFTRNSRGKKRGFKRGEDYSATMTGDWAIPRRSHVTTMKTSWCRAFSFCLVLRAQTNTRFAIWVSYPVYWKAKP